MIIKKNLIIGAATGYKKKDLFKFVESLRSVFFEDVILIMNKTLDAETNHYLNSKNIKIFFTGSTSRTIFKDRYQIYLDIIKYNHNLNKIMLTDTKDVIFQINPFDNSLFSKLNFFLEDKNIKDCKTNSRWILRAYSQKIFQKLANKKISCSGATLGKRKYIIKYCSQMVLEIKNNKYLSLNPFNKGSDQGNHNIVVNSYKFNFAKKFLNNHAFVVNLSNSNPKSIKFNKNFFRIGKKKISVIHQYNSHQKIDRNVNKYIYDLNKVNK
jgi:hypothetical protein